MLKTPQKTGPIQKTNNVQEFPNNKFSKDYEVCHLKTEQAEYKIILI